MYKQLAISFFFVSVIAITFYMIRKMAKPNDLAYSKKRIAFTLAFIFYLSAVAALTIVPLRMSRTTLLSSHFNFTPVINNFRRYFNVTKAHDADGIANFYENLFGNILMFIPLGVFLPWLYNKTFRKTILIAALCSCLIEFIQYLNMFLGYYRYVDIDDVLLNTLGAMIGFWLYKMFFNAAKNTGI
jgi:glycopeptide antibiotics resistance protein